MSVLTEVIATFQGTPAVSTGASCLAPGLAKINVGDRKQPEAVERAAAADISY